MRLLLASAEDDTTESLMIGLKLRGHLVERASSGLIAFSLGADTLHDAILIDHMLPYLEGIDVVRHLRRRQVRQPIILLSANGSQGHQRIAKEAGANAVVLKPVSIDEIDAIFTTLRNPANGLRQSIRRGGIEVDRGRRCVTRNGRCVPLTRAQTRLMWLLAEQAGDVVSREELYDYVFRYNSGDLSGMLSSMVAGLRKRLHAPGEPELIETLRGIGYRLVVAPAAIHRERTSAPMVAPQRTSPVL